MLLSPLVRDVSTAAAVNIAAATTAMGAIVADGAGGAFAALDASVVDDPAAGCYLDHRRGTWWSVCRGGPTHGLHFQSWVCRRPHGQRLARGLRNPPLLVQLKTLRPSNPSLEVFHVEIAFHYV